MDYEILSWSIGGVVEHLSDTNLRVSQEVLKDCIDACPTIESLPERLHAASDIADAYCKLSKKAMENGIMTTCLFCVIDSRRLNAMFPDNAYIAHRLVLCIVGLVHLMWKERDTGMAGEYMDEVLKLAQNYPQSIDIQRDTGICMGYLVELCGCVKEFRPLAYDGIRRMEAVAERFPEDEQLQTIYAHILVEGCKRAYLTADTERLNALRNKLQSLMDEKTDVINVEAVRRRLQNIEDTTEKETSTEQTAQSELCRELQQSIQRAAAYIPGWELAQSRQRLNDCLIECSKIESPQEKRQTVTALADVYLQLAQWSMECGNLFTSLNCVLDCRDIHSMFPKDANIAYTLLQCITGLIYVKLQQREDGMVEEYIDEVLALAEAYPQNIEVQRQSAMCMGNLVALCGGFDAPLSLAYGGIERMDAVADRFPQDEDLQNVYAHILVSGCYFADHTGNEKRLKQFRARIKELQEQRARVINALALRQHIAKLGLE